MMSEITQLPVYKDQSKREVVAEMTMRDGWRSVVRWNDDWIPTPTGPNIHEIKEIKDESDTITGFYLP